MTSKGPYNFSFALSGAGDKNTKASFHPKGEEHARLAVKKKGGSENPQRIFGIGKYVNNNMLIVQYLQH